MIKVNYKLKGYDLIKDIIRVLRHYKLKVNNVDNKFYCHNFRRRFKYQKYVNDLIEDLRLQWQVMRFLRRHKKEGI